MPTLTFTVRNQVYSINATDVQNAKLAASRDAEMRTLPFDPDPESGQDENTPIEERPNYKADEASYLGFVIERSGESDVLDVASRWLGPADGVPVEIAPSPVPPSPEALQSEYANEVQKYLDATAQSNGYNDELSIVSYRGSTVAEWKADATAYIAWRDQVWTSALATLEQVKAGSISMPTKADFIAGLPKIVWPS